jgi:hypothetical protein
MHCCKNFLCGTASRSFCLLVFQSFSFLVFHFIVTPVRKATAELSAANILIDSMLRIDVFL